MDLLELIREMQGEPLAASPAGAVVDTVYIGKGIDALTDDLTAVLVVTNLVHARLMELATEVDIVGICFTSNHVPKEQVLHRAKDLEIPLFRTPLSLDECREHLGPRNQGVQVVEAL